MVRLHILTSKYKKKEERERKNSISTSKQHLTSVNHALPIPYVYLTQSLSYTFNTSQILSL